MKIALDMDNTIIDEFGATLRPGIIEFLDYLSKNHDLLLWTNSKKIRAYEMVRHFDLRKYFSRIIAREDYDANENGCRKNIRERGIDILVDDDPEEIYFTRQNGGIGILVESYRKNKPMKKNELPELIKKYKL